MYGRKRKRTYTKRRPYTRRRRTGLLEDDYKVKPRRIQFPSTIRSAYNLVKPYMPPKFTKTITALTPILKMAQSVSNGQNQVKTKPSTTHDVMAYGALDSLKHYAGQVGLATLANIAGNVGPLRTYRAFTQLYKLTPRKLFSALEAVSKAYMKSPTLGRVMQSAAQAAINSPLGKAAKELGYMQTGTGFSPGRTSIGSAYKAALDYAGKQANQQKNLQILRERIMGNKYTQL